MSRSDVIIEDVSNEIDPEEYFEILSDVYRDHQRDPEKFLSTCLYFVNKKTRFFKEGDPRHKVIHAMIKAGIKKNPNQKNVKSPATASSGPSAQNKVSMSQSTENIKEEKPSTSNIKEENISKKEKDDVDEDEDEKSKGLIPNSGNGADYEDYTWTQDLSEVFVSVKLPVGTNKKSMEIKIEKETLKVGLKDDKIIIDGELFEPIKTEESYWNIDGNTVEIALQKKKGMTWWKSVIKGHPEINTQKVSPENSKLSDLDGETRAMVEKMMEDNRRKQMGLPSTEDEKKMEMLKKFQAAHPEMDFSKAKMM